MIAQFSTYGFSAEARQIAAARDEQDRRLRELATPGKQKLLDELSTVWEDCQYPNWDGYEARAVSPDSFLNAHRFLMSLPLGVPAPSIGAEPDGEVTLEWHHSRWRTLSVSVTADGNLHFSGLFGPSHQNGTTAFFGDFPEELLPLIKRVYAP